MLWQTIVYRSVLASGYGSPGSLFAGSNVWPNLQRYPAWLVSLHTPWVLAAFAAPALMRGSGSPGPAADRARARTAAALVVYFLLSLAFYAVYTVFDSWAFLRFLLPVLPGLIVLFAAAIAVLLGRLAAPARVLVGTAIGVALITSWLQTTGRLEVFAVGASERRFVDAAMEVRGRTPANAVVFSMLHSGSLTYYAQREIARWDQVPGDGLPATLESSTGSVSRCTSCSTISRPQSSRCPESAPARK